MLLFIATTQRRPHGWTLGVRTNSANFRRTVTMMVRSALSYHNASHVWVLPNTAIDDDCDILKRKTIIVLNMDVSIYHNNPNP